MALQAIAAKNNPDIDTRMGLQLGHSGSSSLYDPRETSKEYLGEGTRYSAQRIESGGDFLIDAYQRINTALDKVIEAKRSRKP
jgi:hypothetical protein